MERGGGGGGGGGGGEAEIGVIGFQVSSNLGEEVGKLALKQAQVIERQTAKNQLRQQELAKAREEAAKLSSPGESPAAFLDTFLSERRQIEIGLDALSNKKRARAAAGDDGQTNPAGLQKQLALMTDSLTCLKESLAVSSYFLPRFDLQSCQAIVSKLEEDLAAARNQIIPKKKFSFASKKKKAAPDDGTTTVDASAAEALYPVSCITASSSPLMLSATANLEQCPSVAQSASRSQGRDRIMASKSNREGAADNKLSKGLRGMKGVVLIRDRDDLVSGEYTLADLEECDVFLRGIVSALFIHNVRNCRVYSGPVMGAVRVEGASGCVFVLASHQIRIHSTEQSDFYLRVRSGPIIEHTTTVRFAPYAFHYTGIEADLCNAGLAEERGLWENVQDFGWLRAAKSPHWSVLPLAERLPPVNGSKADPLQ